MGDGDAAFRLVLERLEVAATFIVSISFFLSLFPVILSTPLPVAAWERNAV